MANARTLARRDRTHGILPAPVAHGCDSPLCTASRPAPAKLLRWFTRRQPMSPSF
ncbi:hypothetical protein KCP74_22965 [Salmonella enterica subsp. enterica]|nr:hypothetical protein KCP74_22965 [Salmonella enterica subsp. enterica]